MRALLASMPPRAVIVGSYGAASALARAPACAAGGVVSVYLSVQNEVGTRLFLVEQLSRGPVVIPRIEGERMVMVRVTDPSALVLGPKGIPTASGPAWTDPIDLLVAPGLAFTADGHRLGHGRGYYDRYLAEHDVRATVGLAWPFQVVDTLPVAPHDRRLDAVLTA